MKSMVLLVFAKVVHSDSILDKESYSTKEHNRGKARGETCETGCRARKAIQLKSSPVLLFSLFAR
jgi:hypothetical protein